MVLLAGVLQQRAIPLPPCGFKTLSGLPCPACGSTRAFAALAAGEIKPAFALNPLAVGSIGVILLAVLVTCLDAALGAGRGARWISRAFTPRVLAWGIAILVLANWSYLIVEGR